MASAKLLDWTRRLAAMEGAFSLIGTGKNAGKTTLLNFLLRYLPAGQIGVTSIGLDGEKLDQIEKLAKPFIRLAPGTLFATAEDCLGRCRGNWTVVQKTNLRTALGPVSVCRCDSQSEVELAGPSRIRDLTELLNVMQAQGARLTLTDGAFDRSASAAARLCQGVVAAAGTAASPDVEAAARQAWALVNRYRLQSWEQGDQRKETRKMNALLDVDIEGLGDRPVVLPDPSSCLIGPESWRRIQASGIRIWVERPVPLLGLFVSSFRPHRPPLDAAMLLQRVGELCGGIAIFDLSQEGELE